MPPKNQITNGLSDNLVSTTIANGATKITLLHPKNKKVNIFKNLSSKRQKEKSKPRQSSSGSSEKSGRKPRRKFHQIDYKNLSKGERTKFYHNRLKTVTKKTNEIAKLSGAKVLLLIQRKDTSICVESKTIKGVCKYGLVQFVETFEKAKSQNPQDYPENDDEDDDEDNDDEIINEEDSESSNEDEIEESEKEESDGEAGTTSKSQTAKKHTVKKKNKKDNVSKSIEDDA